MVNGIRKMDTSNCPSYGDRFTRFNKGCHKRMGDISCPDRAISIEIMLEMCKMMEDEWLDVTFKKFAVAEEAAFYLIAFCCALRGEEVPKTDLNGIIKYWESSGVANPEHVVVPVFKGETGINYHLMPLVSRTRSGLEPRKWIGRLMVCHLERNNHHGPFFRKHNSEPMKSGDMSNTFYKYLGMVQDYRPDLLPRDVEVEDVYGISRSFRRGSNSRAVDRGVPPEVIDSNNRWRKVEQAGSMQPSLSMREHYMDVQLALNQFLRYSIEL
jgi:hypothetical protein